MDKAHEISKRLAEQAEAVCRAFLPNGRRVGSYWQVGNINGDAGHSLSVRLHSSEGGRRGRWVDYATGEYGDLLDIIAARSGTEDFPSTLIVAERFLGENQFDVQRVFRSTKPSGPSGFGCKTRAGARLFSLGEPIGDTLAQTYLRNRQIERFGEALKFHRNVSTIDDNGKHLSKPALLASITDEDGHITGCARTWLDPETATVASMTAPKRILGSIRGKAVRFPDLFPSCDQIVGEGLESLLSVGTALPDTDLAACLTATNLSFYQPPARIRRLWVAHDNDKAGERALSILKARAETLHFRVFHLPPLRNDHNDDLKALGKVIMAARLKQIIRSQAADAFPHLQ